MLGVCNTNETCGGRFRGTWLWSAIPLRTIARRLLELVLAIVGPRSRSERKDQLSEELSVYNSWNHNSCRSCPYKYRSCKFHFDTCSKVLLTSLDFGIPIIGAISDD
jgi:hypothetical protein